MYVVIHLILSMTTVHEVYVVTCTCTTAIIIITVLFCILHYLH